jgi:Ankyrin repeats (many copies)/Ankyrin repeat
MSLVQAIVRADEDTVAALLAARPPLAAAPFAVGATRQDPKEYHLDDAGYIHQGDSALHVAAMTHQPLMVRKLIAAGADIRAKNRMGAEPLHCAAMGSPGSPKWNPDAQAATIACLIAAGADPNALDKRGVAPLHRAVRTRCAAAVEALLDAGADARLKNKNGSTPLLLATQNTGRGGSGSPEAKAQRARIFQLLEVSRRR